TAVYITRATALAFFGGSRHEGHPHDPPPLMRIALVVLAVGATFGGVLGLSATSGVLPKFLEPVFLASRFAVERRVGPSAAALAVISVAVALIGLGLAWFVYGSGRIDWQAL